MKGFIKRVNKSLQKVEINTPYITLGQFLKLTNEFESGGHIKHYLSNTGVYVNGEHESRRGKKLYDEDVITIENNKKFIVKQVRNV